MSEEKQAAEQVFEISKLYMKDVSFESPHTPSIFTDGEWSPEMSVQINGANTALADDFYESVLTVTVTVKQNEKTAFLIEVQQAGVFVIKGYPEDSVQGILATHCLEILFPYAREEVSSLVLRGGFPQLILSPVNFNALYQQQLEAQQATSEQKEAAH